MKKIATMASVIAPTIHRLVSDAGWFIDQAEGAATGGVVTFATSAGETAAASASTVSCNIMVRILCLIARVEGILTRANRKMDARSTLLVAAELYPRQPAIESRGFGDVSGF